MAKGNMFQGQARGSVGDVVFYRMDNMQIARVRNRKPQNPKTQRQMAQRAIMSTIMQAYSHGKEIFDHSFEGKKVPMGSMREFLSRNANALRQALIYDFEVQSTAHVNALVNAPKTNSPQPNQYVISAGSLQNGIFNITDASQTSPNAIVSIPEALEDETMAEYAKRIGLHVGDIFTIVGFALNTSKTIFSTPNGVGAGAYQEQGQFFFLRLIVTDAINSEELASSMNFVDIFIEDASQGIDKLGPSTTTFAGYSDNLANLCHFASEGWIAVATGIIRSELNSGLRSNETLHWCKWGNAYGINWANLYKAWDKDTDALGNSDLILEGGQYGEEIVLGDGLPVGITAVGNYLGINDEFGNTSILTYNGQAVMLDGGRVRVQTNGQKTGNATPIDLGTYQGSLSQLPATFALSDGEDGPAGSIVAKLVINVDDKSFISKNSGQGASTSESPLTFDASTFRGIYI